MTRKILVTGANGHIGCHAIRAVQKQGWTAQGLVRKDSDRRGLEGLDVRVFEGDLLEPDTLGPALEGVDAVLHAGAVHRNFHADPEAILGPSRDGTRNVIEAARSAGVKRFVQVSTAATMGFARDVDSPINEESRIENPRAVYVRGKLEAEQVALEAASEDFNVVVLNPSGVFGARDHRITPATAALIGMIQGDPAFLGVCVTDVGDVARAMVLAVENGKSGRRYLITGDRLVPKVLAETLASVTGIRPPTFRPPGFLLRFLAGRMEKKALAEGTDAGITRDLLADLDGGHLLYDSTRSRTELGMEYRPAKDVLQDSYRWLLFVGALKPKVAARLRKHMGDAASPDTDWVS